MGVWRSGAGVPSQVSVASGRDSGFGKRVPTSAGHLTGGLPLEHTRFIPPVHRRVSQCCRDNPLLRQVYEGGEVILAVDTPDGNNWCNPNSCAQKWVDELECFSGIGGTRRNHRTDFGELDLPEDVFPNRCGTVCRGD